MKLFNKGRRTINPNTPAALLPGRWSPDLTDAEAAKMLKMFPNELTSAEAPVTGPSAKELELAAENAKLKESLAAMETRLANLETLASPIPSTTTVEAPEPEQMAQDDDAEEPSKRAGKKHGKR